MTAATPALTGSSLIKALKAPQDPPTPGGERKVALAAAAWADPSLLVPRKADVVRDFVLEQWTRCKPGWVAVFDVSLHQSKQPDSRPSIP